MGKINAFAFLIHAISLISMFVEIFIMTSRVITVSFFSVFGLTLFSYILSYFFVVRKKKDILTIEKAYWYGFFCVSGCLMKVFTSGINAVNVLNGISYIFVILLLIGLTFLFLWTSKNIFSRSIHIMNIILICTYLIFELSELFSYYYIYVYNVDIPVDMPINIYNTGKSGNVNVGFRNRTFAYIKFSIRYFFELPPQEYVDIVTILQFITGKVYEAVLLGGVISGLSSAFVNKKNGGKDLE